MVADHGVVDLHRRSALARAAMLGLNSSELVAPRRRFRSGSGCASLFAGCMSAFAPIALAARAGMRSNSIDAERENTRGLVHFLNEEASPGNIFW